MIMYQNHVSEAIVLKVKTLIEHFVLIFIKHYGPIS